ncbi:protein VAPYRIN-like [Leptopilina heterotoma]|uniref:protein VAPYRIN-like n=1 Tax=Leptopilina heterotoma TaxID=63436 RepID=UPI001CA9BAF3|nr:protein VAPYRIN-like [Leptopilina heterotoma]XP_043472616.1 protein VAPYRIN-like [Leptopilina heterotoma]
MESEFVEIMDERKKEKYPLQHALQFGSLLEIQDILSEKYQATFSSENDKAQKCREIINFCLDKKLDVNTKRTKYSALLHFVIKHLDKDFQSVINKCEGFDINALNEMCKRYDKKSLLHLAIEERKQNAVKVLIEFGADVEVKDDGEEQTPLFYAVSSKQVEIAEILLKAGADINATNQREMMPINYAFGERKNSNSNEKYKPSKLVTLLCSYGASLNFKNESGTITLLMAFTEGHFREVEFLIEHGADLFSIHFFDNITPINDIWEEIDCCEIQKLANMVEFSADNGSDINMVSMGGYTILILSVANNYLEITECLLELNAKFQKDKYFPQDYISLEVVENLESISDRISTWTLLTAFFALKNIDIPENSILYEEFEWVSSFFEECKEQVIKMQERRIWADRKVSFFDFLNEDLLKVTKYFRNDDVMSVLESGKYDQFPNYTYMFEKRKERVEKMNNCQNVFIRFIEEFFKGKLPIVVIDEIISYLSAGELRNFGRALCITEKSPNGEYFI